MIGNIRRLHGKLCKLQKGSHKCKENFKAVIALEKAIYWLRERERRLKNKRKWEQMRRNGDIIECDTCGYKIIVQNKRIFKPVCCHLPRFKI